MQEVGKNRRLHRIFSSPSGKIVIVPLDDSLLAGAINGLEDIEDKIIRIISASPNAIIGFQGLLRNYSQIIDNTPTILNITASTTNGIHTRKCLVSSVELAVKLGADAVAVHVNLTSRYEFEMLKIFEKISLKCEKFGMPLLGIMYPRKENIDGTDNNYHDVKKESKRKYGELIAHAARVGVELGADIIKTQFTGDIETFEYVITACKPIPVVVAGGLPTNINQILNIAHDVIKAGGAGVSFGRNIFSRDNPIPYVLALKEIVHNNKSVDEALDIFNTYLIQ